VRPVVKPENGIKPNVVTKPSNGVKLAPNEANSASEFLKFAEDFADLSAPIQKQALTNTSQVLLANPNDLLHRMKLMMIYGLPSSSLADTPKAQNLLQQILQENILLGSQQAFAHVMFDYLVALNKLNKSTHNDDKLVEQLQLKLEATQQKLDAAQQKVNELKNIEKSMGEREAAPKEAVPKK
jgi:vacuolar-type H+-ATPase catalytic subunit A/Vma1